MITNYVKNWLARADEDMGTIRLLLKEKDASLNPICFHAQQAGEKYLKGFLACHDMHVRKIHDLEVLMKDCENVDKSFVELTPQAKILNKFYTEARYPDDYVEFSTQDAQDGYKAAKEIRDFVMTKIQSS
jgi:HEPN domain-containing protein